jgi:hypothetical protein
MGKFFSGIGFVIAAIIIMRYMPAGIMWGWSFFIPALSCMGHGLGEYIRWREQQRQQFQLSAPQQPLNAPYVNPNTPQVSAPTTSSLTSPSSITEHTTRHLEPSRESESK